MSGKKAGANSNEGNPKEYKHRVLSTAISGNYKQNLKTNSSEKLFKCSECPFRTKNKRNLNHHVKIVHLLRFATGSSRPFPCPHPGCIYGAKTKSDLTRHSKIHSEQKPWFCSHPNCNYSTNFTTNFTRHIRLHTGEKPYVCQFESCSYAATNSTDLVTHSRTHTKEKPYKCTESHCEYLTSQKSNLKRHQLIHKSLGKPEEGKGAEHSGFKCPLCDYSSLQGNLPRHIKTHFLEKLFKCDEPNCNYEAKRKEEIKGHKVVHFDEKPFACPVESCEYRCKRNRDLSSHLKTHSEERQYKCELCPFRGKQRGAVANHIKIAHV